MVNTPAYIIAGLIALLVIAGIVTVVVRRRKRARQPGRHERPADPVSGPMPVGRSEQRRTN
jgi:LPXTG-motif cell wall-anchored protein